VIHGEGIIIVVLWLVYFTLGLKFFRTYERVKHPKIKSNFDDWFLAVGAKKRVWEL
jgi:hypothetical protein